MRPEHRHELKTNELAQWLANFPQWAKKNTKIIVYISIAVIFIAGFYFYRSYQKVTSVKKQLALTNLIIGLSQSKMQILAAGAQGIDYSFILIQPADNLKILAETTKDNQMAALALIKRADALRTELHYRFAYASEQETASQLDKAKASYTEALTKASPNPSLMAAAKFGLGLCEEELGNFEKASQIYRDIVENNLFEDTTAVAQANRRLATMADYQQKLAFKAPSKPAGGGPTKLIQPQLELQPGTELIPDINIATEIPQLEIQLPDFNIEPVPNSPPTE